MPDGICLGIADDEALINRPAPAERIRLPVCDTAEMDVLHLPPSCREAVRAPRTMPDGQIHRPAAIRHIDVLKEQRANVCAVHAFHRNAASVDVFENAASHRDLLNAIIGIRAYLDAAGQRLNHQILRQNIPAPHLIGGFQAEAVIACHNPARAHGHIDAIDMQTVTSILPMERLSMS